MTLVEITNLILSKFNNNDIIEYEDLNASMKFPPELEHKKSCMILAGLKKLEDSGVITCLDKTPSSLSNSWILSQPLRSQGQTIDLTMETCNEIAEIINSFLDAHDVKGVRADKLNIQEQEIAMLINIINDVITTDPPQKDDEGD